MTGNGPGREIRNAFETAREEALAKLEKLVGMVQACAVLGVSRATHYRHHRKSPAPDRPRRERGRHHRALAPEEEAHVLDVLHSPEFADMAPAEIYAVLLDRGVYLRSESTMYRLLRRHGEVRERRRQAVHPPRKIPELVATGPSQVFTCRVAGRNLTSRSGSDGALLRRRPLGTVQATCHRTRLGQASWASRYCRRMLGRFLD